MVFEIRYADKTFSIPISDSGTLQEEMNRFLRSKKVLEITQELCQNQSNALWCFCVKYIEGREQKFLFPTKKVKIDYKSVLDEATFEKFSKLRVVRKKLADEDGVPAYAVFTDAELAEISKLEKIDEKTIQSIKGIGQAKAKKYGDRISKI